MGDRGAWVSSGYSGFVPQPKGHEDVWEMGVTLRARFLSTSTKIAPGVAHPGDVIYT